MDDFRSILLQHVSEFEEFLITTDTLPVILLDKDLTISAHNRYFSKLISAGKDVSGNSIHAFLTLESHDLLPLSGSTTQLSVWLTFKSPDASPAPLKCHIFKSDNEEYLILGGHLMLTNEQVLQEMTVLSNEMTKDIGSSWRCTSVNIQKWNSVMEFAMTV